MRAFCFFALSLWLAFPVRSPADDAVAAYALKQQIIRNATATSVSPAGALGLGQLMPGTAAGLGVDPNDPQQNLHGVAVHLRGLLDRYRGLPGPERYRIALAAYNAGSGAVARYGGIPPYAETRRYVVRVMALWRRLCGYEMPGR